MWITLEFSTFVRLLIIELTFIFKNIEDQLDQISPPILFEQSRNYH